MYYYECVTNDAKHIETDKLLFWYIIDITCCLCMYDTYLVTPKYTLIIFDDDINEMRMHCIGRVT